MTRLLQVAAVLLAACALPAIHASSGVAIDPKGQPIADVRVCYVAANAEPLCVSTAEDGSWSLPASRLDTVRLSHPGFLPATIGGGEQPEPVMLRPAAILYVRLEDLAGNPISEGEVDVILTSGKRYGPFPIQSEKGVLVNSMDPGPVVILARSKGYAETRAEEDELRAGEKTSVVIRLGPAR